MSVVKKCKAGFGICGSILFLLFMLVPFPVRAARGVDLSVDKNQAVLDFPNTVSFQLTVRGSATIERIVLEYGVDQLACGEVVAKAFPDFEPAMQVDAEWTWDMRKSGSEPPGAKIWWQWRVTDSNGGEELLARKEIIWLDSIHSWREMSGDPVTVHWYQGDTAYGEEMLTSALQSVRNINELIDLAPDGTVDIYLYGDYEDLRDAILYEPGWTGGQSYGDYNVIILGIPEGSEAWGKSAVAHELMHNVVDRFTFSCLVRIPSWIHEGLAMVSEGGPGEEGMAVLQRAIDQNSIFPLRGLGGGFPEDSDQALLAYYQSYSVVDFLIRRGDASRMRSLLELLGRGATADDALQQLYGFNVDGLDAAWRDSVGAESLPQEELEPTPTPTVVPTFQPMSINPDAISTAGAGDVTLTPLTTTPVISSDGGGLLTGSLIGICFCGLCLLLLLGITAIILIGISRRKP